MRNFCVDPHHSNMVLVQTRFLSNYLRDFYEVSKIDRTKQVLGCDEARILN